MARTRSRKATLALAVALFVSGCGSSGSGQSTEPTVAERPFDGLFSLTVLTIAGDDETPLEPIVFEIDDEFGGLAIDTACGILLGSFSFFDDGVAGITVAGRSRQTCGPDVEAQVTRLLDTFSRISTWTRTDTGIDLRSPTGDWLQLVG